MRTRRRSPLSPRAGFRLVALGCLLATLLAACAPPPPPPPPQGGDFNPTTDTNLPADDYNFDSVTIAAGVKVTVDGSATITVSGDTTIDGTLAAQDGALMLTTQGALSVGGALEVAATAPTRLTAQQSGPEAPLKDQPVGLFIVAQDTVNVSSSASLTVDGPLVLTDDPAVLEMTPTEINDDAASASGDLPTLVPLPADDPVFGEASGEVSADAAGAGADNAPIVPQQAVQHSLSGSWDLSGLAGEQSVLVIRFDGPADLLIDGWTVTMAGGTNGADEDTSEPTAGSRDLVTQGRNATGKRGRRSPNSVIQTTSGSVVLGDNESVYNLGNGGDGGDAKATCATARGGNGGPSGILRITAAGGIAVGRFTINPGRSGHGGNAEVTGKNGCDATAFGGHGEDHERRLFRRGNVQIFDLRIGTLTAGNGGNATATAGDRGNNGDPCANGRRGGNATSRGGNGGNASLEIGGIAGVSVSDVIGGNAGNATSTGGQGETSGPGDCATGPGGNGGRGGNAIADGGRGGNATLAGTSAAVLDSLAVRKKRGGNATANGGNGGNGADSCTLPAKGGDGGNGGRAEANAGTVTSDGTNAGKSGNGGNGGDGDPVGSGGNSGTKKGTPDPDNVQSGEKGKDGSLCGSPPPPPPPSKVTVRVENATYLAVLDPTWTQVSLTNGSGSYDFDVTSADQEIAFAAACELAIPNDTRRWLNVVSVTAGELGAAVPTGLTPQAGAPGVLEHICPPNPTGDTIFFDITNVPSNTFGVLGLCQNRTFFSGPSSGFYTPVASCSQGFVTIGTPGSAFLPDGLASVPLPGNNESVDIGSLTFDPLTPFGTAEVTGVPNDSFGGVDFNFFPGGHNGPIVLGGSSFDPSGVSFPFASDSLPNPPDAYAAIIGAGSRSPPMGASAQLEFTCAFPDFDPSGTSGGTFSCAAPGVVNASYDSTTQQATFTNLQPDSRLQKVSFVGSSSGGSILDTFNIISSRSRTDQQGGVIPFFDPSVLPNTPFDPPTPSNSFSGRLIDVQGNDFSWIYNVCNDLPIKYGRVATYETTFSP